MSNPLDNVRAASEAVASAREALHSAIRDASETERIQAIADAAGLSRQRVYQLVGPRREESWQRKAEARLAELDARWSALVDKVAEVERPPDSYIQRENAKRNARRGKDARAGRPQRPSVLQEARSAAESKLLRTLLDHSEDPSVLLVLSEIEEAEGLRERLQALYDRKLGL